MKRGDTVYVEEYDDGAVYTYVGEVVALPNDGTTALIHINLSASCNNIFNLLNKYPAHSWEGWPVRVEWCKAYEP